MPNPPSPQGGSIVRHIERDRAYLLLLGWGARAAYSPSDADRPRVELPEGLAGGVREFGAVQEQLLIGLAPHVHCVRNYALAVRDRRIIEFEVLDVLRPLVAFTSAFTELERLLVLRWAGDDKGWNNEDQAGGIAAARGKVLDHGEKLAASLIALGERLRPWVGSDSDGVCRAHSTFAAVLPRVLAQADGPPLPGRHGFAPYLTLLSATALSSVGHDSSAQALLLDWLRDRARLEARLKQPRASPAPSSQSSRVSAELELVQRALVWHRFQVSQQAAWLRALAASSGEHGAETLPSQNAQHFIVYELFPTIFSYLEESMKLEIWRTTNRPRDACLAPRYRWRQPLVISYLSFAKDYLDLILSGRGGLRELDLTDLDLAKLLAEVNIDCFPEYGGTLAVRQGDRAGYTLTAVAARLNYLRRLIAERTPIRLTEGERTREILELDSLLLRSEEDIREYDRYVRSSCDHEPDHALCIAFDVPGSMLSIRLRHARLLLEELRRL
jgi:hypothetical protein